MVAHIKPLSRQGQPKSKSKKSSLVSKRKNTYFSVHAHCEWNGSRYQLFQPHYRGSHHAGSRGSQFFAQSHLSPPSTSHMINIFDSNLNTVPRIFTPSTPSSIGHSHASKPANNMDEGAQWRQTILWEKTAGTKRMSTWSQDTSASQALVFFYIVFPLLIDYSQLYYV